MGQHCQQFTILVAFAIATGGCRFGTLLAATVSPLLARGYTVIPEPQKVMLAGPDFEFTPSWQLELGPGVAADDIAVDEGRARGTISFCIAASQNRGRENR